MRPDGWWNASKNDPCPVCGADHTCSSPPPQAGKNGRLHLCHHAHNPVPGWRYLGPAKDPVWHMHLPENSDWYDQEFIQSRDRRTASPAIQPTRNGPKADDVVRPDFQRLHQWAAARMAPSTLELLGNLARDLHVTSESLAAVGCVRLPRHKMLDECRIDSEGWKTCWGFPEYDGHGAMIGILRRYDASGQKKMTVKGGQRGLSYDVSEWTPDRIATDDRTIYVVEGPSDTAAATAMGLRVVGRPSNTGGAEHLSVLLRNVPAWVKIVILGENDQDIDANGMRGDWPGRDGCNSVAGKLARTLNRPIHAILPPPEAKDVRDWLHRRCADLSKIQNHDRLGLEFEAALVPICVHEPPAQPEPVEPTPPAEPRAVKTPQQLREEAWRLEQEEEERHAEAILYQKVKYLEYDFEHLPCHHPKEIMLESKDEQGQALKARCRRWKCEGCRAFLKQREILSAALHFKKSGGLCVSVVPVAQWDTFLKRIHRARDSGAGRGNFFRIDSPDGLDYLVITDSPVGDPIRVEVAIELFTARIQFWEGEERPISASHGWHLPRKEVTCSTFRRIGIISADEDETRAIAAHYGVEINDSNRPSIPSVIRWRCFVGSERLSVGDRRDFYRDLMLGNVPGRECKITIRKRGEPVLAGSG